MTEPTVDRHVRGIPAELYRRTKLVAVRRGITVGAIVTEALREWLARQPREASQ